MHFKSRMVNAIAVIEAGAEMSPNSIQSIVRSFQSGTVNSRQTIPRPHHFDDLAIAILRRGGSDKSFLSRYLTLVAMCPPQMMIARTMIQDDNLLEEWEWATSIMGYTPPSLEIDKVPMCLSGANCPLQRGQLLHIIPDVGGAVNGWLLGYTETTIILLRGMSYRAFQVRYAQREYPAQIKYITTYRQKPCLGIQVHGTRIPLGKQFCLLSQTQKLKCQAIQEKDYVTIASIGKGELVLNIAPHKYFPFFIFTENGGVQQSDVIPSLPAITRRRFVLI